VFSFSKSANQKELSKIFWRKTMDKANDLETRLLSLSDREIFEIVSEDSKMYSDEAVETAREIARLRGLVSDLGDEFKVITAGGRENGPLDALLIKGLFSKKLINPESLLYVESRQQWLPLREVFDITRWNVDPNYQTAKTINLTAKPVVTEAPPKIETVKTQAPQADAPIIETSTRTGQSSVEKSSEERLPAFIAHNLGDVSLASYRGAGGWLLLFAVFMVIWRLYGILLLQTQLLAGPRNVYNFGMTVVAIEYVVGLFAVILLLFESRQAVLVTKIYLAGLLVFNIALLILSILGGGVASVLSSDKIYLTSGEHLINVLKQIALGRFIVLDPSIVHTAFVAVLVIFAFLYFSTSRRVRATYFSNDETD
jgi:hypothetical protein